MGDVILLDKYRKKKDTPKLVAWFVGSNKMFKAYLAAKKELLKQDVK